jgi:hypothetical protein
MPTALTASRCVGKVSAAESMQYLLRLLREGSPDTKRTVVFVLDEADQFALRHRQTIIYTLLDASLQQQQPVSVVAMTARMVRGRTGVVGRSSLGKQDILDLLDKRVKSRFSHHSFVVLPPATPEAAIAFMQSALALPTVWTSPSATVLERQQAMRSWQADIAAAVQAVAKSGALARSFHGSTSLSVIVAILVSDVMGRGRVWRGTDHVGRSKQCSSTVYLLSVSRSRIVCLWCWTSSKPTRQSCFSSVRCR